jgi:hypothetical protein
MVKYGKGEGRRRKGREGKGRKGWEGKAGKGREGKGWATKFKPNCLLKPINPLQARAEHHGLPK